MTLIAVALSASLGAADALKTRELIAVLTGNSELAARARACQQLAIVGTSDAVPALAALLADEKLGPYARDALEVMPDAAAVAALRQSLTRLSGDRLIGVINSLGVRRDPASVAPLTKFASGNSPAAPAALRALGRIATPEAVRLLLSTLGSGSAELRNAAASALLIAVERVAAQPPDVSPTEIYERLRRADISPALRVTATRGAILLGGTAALPLMLEQLRSADEPMRDMALRCVRELRGDEVVAAVTKSWNAFPTAVQVRLIGALADRGGPAELAEIEGRVVAVPPELRVAALQALGRIGRDSSVPLLLRATGANAAEADAAWASLARIKAPGADAAILGALDTIAPGQRARLIGVLGERSAESATPALLRLAVGSDPAIRAAALRTLGVIAKPRDLREIVQLALIARNEEELTLADRAIVTTSMKILEPERRAEPALAAYRAATDPVVKSRLLRPLGAIVRMMGGNHEVFFAIRPMLGSADAGLRQAALKVLADWPDAAPVSQLLALANQPTASAADRTTALRGALRMATNVAAGRERSPLNVVDAFAQAKRAVQTKEEKLMLVSGLGSLKRPEVLALLQPYLADPDVRTEAGLALVQVAPALGGIRNTPALKPLLERIAADDPDEQVRQKAARLAKGAAPEAGKAKAKGKAKMAAPATAAGGAAAAVATNDLGGWDGDPGVWRVRDGVMVGGSLEGNPRNEFLATKRSYADFVLRVEYRLIGTDGFVNGGVQFRSVRIPQPPNEMSGYQADIGAGHSGCLYDESRRKKFLARATDEQIKRLEKPGEWNAYEIRCQGPRIELSLNGEKTVVYTEAEPGIARDGLIALQIHGNCKAEIQFRNFVLEEISR